MQALSAAPSRPRCRPLRAAPLPELACWTNPAGRVLTELVPGRVWAAERAFVWNGIDVGGRSVVVKLASGSLWVHSPVAPDASLRAALAELGPVESLVAPNYEHVKHASAWLAAYPQARGYGCPGLREAAPELGLHADVLGSDGSLPASWGGELEVLWLDWELNPFTGKPFFNELLFLHRPSGCVCVTDAWWNYPPYGTLPWPTRAWKAGMDVVYAPFFARAMVKDKAAARRIRAAVAAWPFDALLPCHGTVLLTGGKAALLARLDEIAEG